MIFRYQNILDWTERKKWSAKLQTRLRASQQVGTLSACTSDCLLCITLGCTHIIKGGWNGSASTVWACRLRVGLSHTEAFHVQGMDHVRIASERPPGHQMGIRRCRLFETFLWMRPNSTLQSSIAKLIPSLRVPWGSLFPLYSAPRQWPEHAMILW